LELSRDGNLVTVSYGTNVCFFETETLKKIKDITIPTRVTAASLHPEKLSFVCGGDDFKMYKYDFITGNEIGKFTHRFFFL
jgi:serine-threonine kinase receptor-associated protein